MDLLVVDNLAFPVRHGRLAKGPGDPIPYCWSIEIHCGSSDELDGAGEQEELGPHAMAGTEPYLYAQLLPLRVESPDELVGRRYVFPQSPEDKEPDWGAPHWPLVTAGAMEKQ